LTAGSGSALRAATTSTQIGFVYARCPATSSPFSTSVTRFMPLTDSTRNSRTNGAPAAIANEAWPRRRNFVKNVCSPRYCTTGRRPCAIASRASRGAPPAAFEIVKLFGHAD